MKDRSYEAARQAIRDRDEGWRDYMPVRWHVARWWWIWGPPLLALLAVLAVGALAMYLVAEMGA
jgi:hypothetical protein